MTVVWTEDRIPKFVLETGGYPDSVRWRLDFDTRDAREAWKRSLTSRPGAKRFLRSSAGRVDLILYPQFRFRNSRLDVMYEVQINLNPTLEVNLWRGSKLTAQLIVPILNEFYKEESRVRPGYLTLSQRFRLPANVLAKATFGNFSMNRWGADLKLFKPVGRHFGIYAEAGLTGISYLYFDGWSYAPMSKWTWMAGGNYLWNRFDLMFDVSAARYLGDDIGATAKVTRYFRRAAVGFYVQKTQKVDYNGGFISLWRFLRTGSKRPPACAGRAVEVFRDGVQCQSLSALRPELRNLARRQLRGEFFQRDAIQPDN